MEERSNAPAHAPLVLGTLILVAAVANLPLAGANVALPSIGLHFDASQTQLNMVAIGYSLGLAASVLWLGALGDRYGRRQVLLGGVLLALPAALASAWAPTIEVLMVARIVGGLAAGAAYPTTLSLITALWTGPARTKAIALWSATGGAIAALGPLTSGIMLNRGWWWGSVFLVVLPLIVAAVPMVLHYVPSHVHETTEPVDNLGGLASVVLVGSLIIAINMVVVPEARTIAAVGGVVAVLALVAFVLRQRRAPNPLYDLDVAARPTFWVAAVAGIIVFGALMGTMFIGQQFLQNVLGYNTLQAGAAALPAAVLMVLIAPRSAAMVEALGARVTLLVGYACMLAGFTTMLILWRQGTSYWTVALGYAFVGAGVGFAGTPASHSLTGSVPVTRVGMASGTADLQRDLGGAIMQSLLGALLTAGYASAVAKTIAASPQSAQVTSNIQAELTKSYAGAETVAQQYPQYASSILQGAKQAFVDGQDWAYLAGIAAVVIGGLVVFLAFPRRDREQELLARYAADDATASADTAGTGAYPPAAETS